MITELIVKDKAIELEQLRQFFFSATGIINNLCLPTGFFYLLPELKEYVNIAALIDYPCGWSASKVRIREIDYAIKSQVNFIDLTVNNTLINSHRFSIIENDFRQCKSLCDQASIPLRVIFEYRLSTYDDISETIGILKHCGMDTMILSTGTLIDDVIDNLMISYELNKKYQINIIACSITRSHDDLKMIHMQHLFGIRFVSLMGAKHILGTLF